MIILMSPVFPYLCLEKGYFFVCVWATPSDTKIIKHMEKSIGITLHDIEANCIFKDKTPYTKQVGAKMDNGTTLNYKTAPQRK